MSSEMRQRDREALTVSTVAVSPAKAASGYNRALFYVGSQPIRFRADGTDPTSTTGMFVAAGSYIDWADPTGTFGTLIAKAKFIRDTTATADATLEAAYFD